MRPVYLIIAILGVTNGAMQQRSPVYPSATTVGGGPANSNQTPFKPPNPTQQQAPPTQAPVQQTQVAQAREGQVAPVDGSSPNAGGPNAPGSSQNYLVYYYPGFRNAPVASGTQPQYAYPPQEQTGTSIWSWSGWREVGYGGSALALAVVGGGLLYNAMQPALTSAKARAMRELSEMKAEDAARMARSVLRAIERFRDMSAGN